MKKLLALVLAVVLSLGLATVAFAADYNAGGMSTDANSSYHNTLDPTIGKNDTIKLWACFDGETQTAEFRLMNEAGDVVALHADGKPINFNGIDLTKNFGYKITDNAQFVKELKITPEYYSPDAETTWVIGFKISITPIDYVIAENKTVKGYFYAWDNNALSTNYIWACNFEIELRNHYIDVDVHDAKGNYLQNNGSTYGYTPNHNDINNCYAMGKDLILYRHYTSGNTSTQPSYVVYTEQFATANTKAPFTFTYSGLVSVTFDEIRNQAGLNFKYMEGAEAFDAEFRYNNPNVKAYTFKFLSKQTIANKATVVLNKAVVKSALGYTNEKEQPVVLYYSADEGKTWTKVNKEAADLTKGDVVYTIEAGNVLGWYRVANAEVGKTDGGKTNVGTGASDMVSVCVALAVVSLVAAGAVCVKKVSK